MLDIARNEEVLITRRGGDAFSVVFKPQKMSPLEVPCLKTRPKATTQDILDAVRESRDANR